MNRLDAADVREEARGRWPDVIRTLAPELRDAIDAGPRRHVPCPVHGGKDGLRVFDNFADSGGLVCNSCGEFPSGFDALMWLTGDDFSTALAAVADALGMNGRRPATTKSRPPAAAPAPTAKMYAEDAATRRERLVKTWQATTKDSGRIAAYLRSRGLSGDVPPALRLHPALPYYSDDDPPVKLGTYPAMIAQVVTLEGEVVNLHRTYLDPAGPGKADVPTPKKLTRAVREGATAGAAIHLAEPPSDLLALTEGIETGLAVQEGSGSPVWACVSAGGLEKVELPAAVRRVQIWGDNDASGRGQEAAEKLAARLRAEGREVRICLPPEVGRDWLDVFVAEGDMALYLRTIVPPEHPEAETTDTTTTDTADEDALLETELDRLAGLSMLAYERERVEASKALGLRASILDELVKARRTSDPDAGGLFLEDPEPWSDSVDGAALLNELAKTAKRYVSLPAGAAEAVALWTIHAHAHDAAEVSPILAATSPTPECGKTTLLTFLQAMVSRPLPASNITAAALFRVVEKYCPTLLIDEADTFLRDNDDLRGVLNSGHAKAGAYVVRTVGDSHEPAVFRTWSPKAIALIGKLPPTLESRSIHVELKRLARGESVEPLRLHQVGVLVPLKRKAARWVADQLEALRTHEPKIPPELYGRAADNWRALLSVADLAGGDWPQRARHAAVSLSAAGSEQTAGILLLEDLRRLFKDRDKLTTVEILKKLNAMDDRPWPEWSRGKELSSRGLGKLLTPFKITSRTVRLGDDLSKGFALEQFSETFGRYLPPCVSDTTTQPGVHAGLRDSLSNTSLDDVSDSNTLFSAVDSQCVGVSDSEPPQEGEDGCLSDSLLPDPAFADEEPEAESNLEPKEVFKL